MIQRLLLALGLFLTLCSPPQARADELRPGYLEFAQVSARDWRLVWRAPLAGGLAEAARPVLPAGCAPLGPARRMLAPPFVTETRMVRCAAPVEGARIGLAGMDAAQTDVLVRIAPLHGTAQALRLTRAAPVAVIAREAGRWEVGRTYLVIGVEHILFGYDHLLFVVALVLLLRRGWTILTAATAFTLAHSITLAGTALGLFGLPQAPVEAGIALSIVFLAVEIAKRREGAPRLSERAPWIVALAFGLLHGFGFAGALRAVGLPAGEVPMALLAFNLGVELGQVGIVLAVLAVLALLRRLAPRLETPAIRTATYAIGALASLWLFERMAG